MGLGVSEFLAFIVSKDRAFFVGLHDILWIDGDFSSSARGIDNILGDGVAGSVAAKAFDDFDPLGNSGSEVGGPLNEIALIEIVGADAAHEEFVNELLLNLDGVVDLVEEDGLVPHHDSGIGEPAKGIVNFGGEFAGVVRVDGNKEGVEFFEHRAEFGRDALGEEDGDARANADELDVGDRVEFGEEFLELAIREKERVTTGEEDIAHLRSIFEILNGLVPLGFQFLVRNSGDDTGPGAIAAVGSAAVGDEEKDAIGVSVNESGDRHVGVFTTRIRHLRGIGVGFLDAWDNLTADGAVRIGRVDEIEKMRGDCGGEFRPGQEDAGPFFLAEGQVLLDVSEGGDAVLQLPLGRIPVFRRDVGIGPVSGCRGSKRDIAQNRGSLDRYFEMSKCGRLLWFRVRIP